LRKSAVIFSPHFDDETLGAGGTIIKKRAMGAEVHVVFMTDGSRSHRAMDGKELSNLRKAEAMEAADQLGVPRSNVIFLDFPEQRLCEHVEDCISIVADLFARVECDQVFIPSSLEPLVWSSDHLVTTDVVQKALHKSGKNPELFEYLVWFWYHWPWVPLWRGNDARQIFRLSVANRFGFDSFRGVNTAVSVADVTSRKRAALEKYRSQMTRLSKDKPWPTLSDVANGEFLKHFFEPTEFFKTYKLSVQGQA
jgi:LmbE family N-acetylglucosaminyl deacetylase